MNVEPRGPDTITAAYLPQLRANMLDYITDEVFSDEFHSICRTVVAAIDQAREDDEATHAALATSLERFTSAGEAEIERCARLSKLFDRIAEDENGDQMRVALAELFDLLPARQVTMLAAAIAEALTAALPDIGLVEMPVVSKRLH
jgi:hypothetical protein